MANLKALLVGVPTNPNYPELNMDSAPRDVARMHALVNKLPNLGPESRCMRLPDPNLDSSAPGSSVAHQTNKATILRQLERFLFADAQAGDQLLFYFSGHGLLFRDPNDPRRVDELICPSNGQPGVASTNIHGDEVVHLAKGALERGACLEIIIEACSASGFIPEASAHTYAFGCYFGGASFPAGGGAVWSASLLHQHSHAGPPRPCTADDTVGLFTHFFCRTYEESGFSLSRLALLEQTTAKLYQYASDCNAECCSGAPNKMTAQTPKLFCFDAGLTAPPLTAGCSLHAVAPPAELVSTCIPGLTVPLPGANPNFAADDGALWDGSGTPPLGLGSLSATGKFVKKPRTCGPGRYFEA